MALTVQALWPTRWPVIAKAECIEAVEALPEPEQHDGRMSLPCASCELNAQCLTGKRREIGPLAYDREQLTSPRTGESSLFPMALWERHRALLRDEVLVPYWDKPVGMGDRYAVVTGWDIAWSETLAGDYLVGFTAAVDRATGLRRVLDIQRVRGLRFREQADLIEEIHGRFRTDLVVIESDFAQTVWTQYVAETTAVPVIGHRARDSKRDLRLGVPSLLMAVESGLWHVPYQPGTYHFDNVAAFLTEAEAFTMLDGKLEGVGEHDDTVMAWWHCEYGVRRMLGSVVGEFAMGIVEGKR